jgi:hypothetical protein
MAGFRSARHARVNHLRKSGNQHASDRQMHSVKALGFGTGKGQSSFRNQSNDEAVIQHLLLDQQYDMKGLPTSRPFPECLSKLDRDLLLAAPKQMTCAPD